MNQTDRLERDLTAWFVDTAVPRTPDYTVDILRQTARVRQRPRWTFPERWLPMSVITLARRTLQPIPWRTVGLVALLGLLIVVALAIYAGGRPRLPAPFGIARNGSLALEDQGDIVLLDPGSGSRRVVIGGPTIDSGPVFSRDGTRLAFFRDTAGRRSLWVSDADGRDLKELSTGPLVDLDGIEWAPDGLSIMLTAVADGVSSISIVPTDGGAARVLNVGMPAEGPRWRPSNGLEILFRGQTPAAPVPVGTEQWPAGYGLYAVRPDGSGLRSITPADGIQFDYLYFGWSPDGEEIAYQRDDPRTAALTDLRLYVVGADGGAPRQITTVDSVNVHWSPDGRHIAFWNMANGERLNVVPADGSAQPSGPARARPPSVSPGRRTARRCSTSPMAPARRSCSIPAAAHQRPFRGHRPASPTGSALRPDTGGVSSHSATKRFGAVSRRKPLRCCPGEGVRRNGLFCRATKASITSAAPTTLTLPTHDLEAGAARLLAQRPYCTG